MKRSELSGITLTTFETPSSDFKPEAADEAMLRRYGIPVGRNAQESTLITNVLSRLKGRLRFVEPEFGLSAERSAHRSPLGKKGTVMESAVSNVWAGAVKYAFPGQVFQWITTEFTIPNVAGTAPGTAGRSSHWVGIDGYTEDAAGMQLCQCGVECDSTQGKDVAQVYLWVEWFPQPAVTVYNKDFTISPGDLLGVTLCTTGYGATSATAYFVNMTTGVVMSPFQFSAPEGVSLVGETAEWISERPLIDGEVSRLGNFGNVVFCQANAGAVSGGSLITEPAGTADVLEMRRSDNDNTLLCEAEVPAPGMVQTIWLASE